MKLIQNITDTIDLEVELAECQVELDNHIKFVASLPLTEDHDMTAITILFDETMKMLAAAKRGLGITNKLKDSPLRTKSRSRIMGNLNRIRAKLGRISKALDSYYTMSDEDMAPRSQETGEVDFRTH